MQEKNAMLACAPLFCYCNVLGQLWQRVKRKPQWTCGAVALALWLLFLAGFMSDMVATESYDKWAHNYDYTDGLHYAEISIITGPAALIFLWLLSTALLKSISEHLKRHDRATWDTAMDGANLRSPCSASHSWLGPACCCCSLAYRLLSTIHKGPDEYSLCVPLVEEEDGRRGEIEV